MKTKIDIVTGFLGSGKTTFINELLKEEQFDLEKVGLIVCERGIGRSSEAHHPNLAIYTLSRGETLSAQILEDAIIRDGCEHIIVEYNGTHKIADFFDIIDQPSIRKIVELNRIISMIEPNSFLSYMKNMGDLFSRQFIHSNIIIVNDKKPLEDQIFMPIKKTIKRLNPYCDFYRFSELTEDGVEDTKEKTSAKGIDKILIFLMILMTPVFLYLLMQNIALTDFGTAKFDLVFLQNFNTIFLSIIIQAFPFILVGVMISSILQVFISEDMIVRFFPKNRIVASLVAIIAGVFMPVCDCAIIPIASRLAKKGIPVSTVITFMFAAPIVNPIVIASTLYAFPGQPYVAAYRVGLGVLIAVLVGVIYQFVREKDSIFLEEATGFNCGCGYCGVDYQGLEGIRGRIKGVFLHASSEFFTVGKFLCIGAFLSTLMQLLIPKQIFDGIGENLVLSVLMMMLLAFIFSICSNSDAFIAKTFTNQFSMGAIMSFIVLGPMMDIENFLMLTGNFKKRFIFKLVGLLFVVAFSVLLIYASFMN